MQNASLVDLEDFTSQEDQSLVAHQCLEFLQKPFFSALVEEVIPICSQQALIVFLKKEETISAQKRQPYTFLDLHGKVPTEVKFKWVDQFIRKAHRNHASTVEIITGRGLNNPQGIMGLLWNRCYHYLCSKKFEPYIEKIRSINKEGGWKVTLKNGHHTKKSKEKKRRKHTVSLYGANAPFKNFKLSVVPALEKKVEPKIIKRKKKSKQSKQPSNSTVSAYTKITAKGCISLELK
ncbi:hypothetical protein IM40_11365 (plasmid) [Candidatus Paracaedimonas acanthamoebae]|nr:hypothetical protein IM40_11365 [Candidatus Paracaedimonas acanthamoebae]